MALAGHLKRHPAHPVYFAGGVDLGVDGAFGAVIEDLDAPGLAEIDAARELADDHQVEASHQLGFQG